MGASTNRVPIPYELNQAIATSRVAVEEAIKDHADSCPIHQYIGPTETADDQFEFEGWNVKPCRPLRDPSKLDQEGYEVLRETYNARLLALLREIKDVPTLTDSEIASRAFFPLPRRWSKGYWRNPWFPTLDNQTLPLDPANFQEGMIEARNFYKWKNQNRLSALLNRVLHHESTISWPGRYQDYDENVTGKVENMLRDLTDRRADELVEFANGFHFTMILFHMRDRWAGNTLRQGSVAAEMDLVIAALKNEYQNTSTSYAFIQSDAMCSYHRNASLVKGSIYGRLQHICLLTEYAKALHGSVYMKTRSFEEGMCSWMVGWYGAPRSVGGIIYDILTR